MPEIDITDPRWGGYCPWFLRHADFSGSGNFLLFFDRLPHRMRQLFIFNETNISNLFHFAHLLESKSLRRFKYKQESYPQSVAEQIEEYFAPDQITGKMQLQLFNHPEAVKLIKKQRSSGVLSREEIIRLQDFEEKYYRPIFIERIGVLENILRLLPKTNGFHDFVKDVRSFMAEAQVMLDIDMENSEIKLLEEPLLQTEVLDKLMPRLSSRFPDRAKELSAAYHDLIGGVRKFDDIFVGAFKTLEELARQITGDSKFEFKRDDLRKYFEKLHPTVHDTIYKLAAHRGAEGGHGRDAPEPQEMRYLLFSICNIALLLLDYNESAI